MRKIKLDDIHRQRGRGGLRRPIHLTLRLTPVEYEFLARKCEGKVMAVEFRWQWFKPGWEKELDILRRKQREKGFDDIDFLHPKQRAELYKEQRNHSRSHR